VPEISNALAVCQAAGGLYALVTVYEESDALTAMGQIIRTGNEGKAATKCILNTAHPLNVLWGSGTGNMWVAASDGTVWTTAPVTWPADPTSILTSWIRPFLDPPPDCLRCCVRSMHRC
jgi:hypothetical protein